VIIQFESLATTRFLCSLKYKFL